MLFEKEILSNKYVNKDHPGELAFPNSPSQDYTRPDDHNLPTYDMTPGFKPFTEIS